MPTSKDPEKRKAISKAWYQRHKATHDATVAAWRAAHPEYWEQQRARMRERYRQRAGWAEGETAESRRRARAEAQFTLDADAIVARLCADVHHAEARSRRA